MDSLPKDIGISLEYFRLLGHWDKFQQVVTAGSRALLASVAVKKKTAPNQNAINQSHYT